MSRGKRLAGAYNDGRGRRLCATRSDASFKRKAPGVYDAACGEIHRYGKYVLFVLTLCTWS